MAHHNQTLKKRKAAKIQYGLTIKSLIHEHKIN